MRYLRKKNDGSLYVWTEALAKRPDMEEVNAPKLAPVSTAVEAPSAPQLKEPTPGQPAIDPYSITDKDELRKVGRENGVVFAGNPSLKNMQAKLAEAMGVSAVVE